MSIAKSVLDVMIDIVEPLPEPDEDVKAFVAEYARRIPKMVPCCGFLLPQEDDEDDEVKVVPLPVQCVDVKSWATHMGNLNNCYNMFDHAFLATPPNHIL